MTFYTIYVLAARFGVDLLKTELEVCEEAATTEGTSADLIAGDILTIKDLLYGLMLPSGNDAAIALSKHFGKLLYEEKKLKEKRQGD